jgi:hypothetical protein
MTQPRQRPEQQTGTGEARSSPPPTQPDRVQDPLRPPDPEEVRDQINRSGSGGSGGPSDGDIDSEGERTR